MKSHSRLFAICLATACLGASLAASAAQAASPAWEPIAASGPTNLPPVQSEIQRVLVDAEGGTYTLTQTTATGSGILSGASIVANLTSGSKTVSGIGIVKSGKPVVGHEVVGPGIPAGTTIASIVNFGTFFNITLSAAATQTVSAASITTGFKLVTGVSTATGSFVAGDGISGTGIPAGTTIAAVGSGTLTLSALPTASGSQALTAGQTTAPIDFDVDASELEAALDALPALEVTVTGGPGDKGATKPYFVTFGGSDAGENVPQMSADSTNLTGGDNHTATLTTALDGGPGTASIGIYPQNVGGVPSSGTTAVEFTLPAGVVTTATPGGPEDPFASQWSCPAGAGETGMTCTSTLVAGPGVTLPPLNVPVETEPGAASGVVEIEVSGGGALGTASYEMPLVVSAIPAPPGLQSWTAGAYTDDGTIDTRAGVHPYSASTGILVNTVRAPHGLVLPAGEFRDIVVDIPPGFLGNPIATEQCPEALEHLDCAHESMVAFSQVPLGGSSGKPPFATGELAAVNNIEAPQGFPAKFRFLTGSFQVLINVAASLRSDEDYGLSAGSYNTPQIKPVMGAFFTFWGTPAASSHDGQRCKLFLNTGAPAPGTCGPGGENVAFLTNPVDCAEEALRPPVATLNVNTWQNPGLLFSHEVALKPVEECENLEFDADFTFEPSETKSDSPASFRTELSVPSEGLVNPAKLMTPTIKESVVELPKGVVLNASAADGLAACSKEQIGLKGTNFPAPNRIRFTKDPQTCPDASKIGSGELKSELIEEPLQGALYLAAQGDGNPFGSLFAIYLVIEDPRHGIFIKLPGEVQVNEADGQQRIVFRELPPLPFTYLRLTLKGGNRSPLASPTTCGNYLTNAINTPWSAPESGPPTTSSNGFEINQGPDGGPCANTPQDRPFDLGLNAGTDSVAAGAFSPLTFQITRPDGAQEIDTLELGTAPGISASLKGVPYCSDQAIAAAASSTGKQEQANPACPAASKVGRTEVGAGSGPTPFYSPGTLYLAGPYKGAPISVVAVTPAVAGPFDLGNVVVRTAVHINRTTAQVTAKADPIPQILKGVPLRIKDVRVVLDRERFSLNPTSCEATAITAKVNGNSGAVANLSSRYQVGGCESLAFKPKLSANLKGGTKRGDHPAFSATVTYPPGAGYANTKDVQVTLPHSEFLDQAHINTICTRVQAAANACPQGAIYGFAEAETPLLDGKLTGPVFLKSSDHQLPDLAIALRGPESQPIEVEFQGRIDSVKAQIRNTIEGLPDVPVSSFTLKMKGGKKGLLVNSRNLCKGKVTRMTVKMVGQNNRLSESRPPLTRSCGKAKKSKRQK